ncbi:MAG: hypothetical protein EOM84_04300 [Sphingobacteriia bacterium]|nr:hypothetical protein [Sphingobacteriia bacterium]
MKRLTLSLAFSLAIIPALCSAQEKITFPQTVKAGQMEVFETQKGFLIIYSEGKKNNFRCGRFVSMQEGLEVYSGDILRKRESQKIIFLKEDFFLSCQGSNVLVSKK